MHRNAQISSGRSRTGPNSNNPTFHELHHIRTSPYSGALEPAPPGPADNVRPPCRPKSHAIGGDRFWPSFWKLLGTPIPVM